MCCPYIVRGTNHLSNVESIGTALFQITAFHAGFGLRSEVDNQLALSNASQNADDDGVPQSISMNMGVRHLIKGKT